jgi:NADH:ubiquinone oxidoreductase subunit 6 (subunit J)
LAHSQIGAAIANGAGASTGEACLHARSFLELFQQYLFPFEATSILILIAILGALVLARKDE